MALTGQAMVLFAVIHLIGNSTIFFGGLNSYAENLHALAPLVWGTRLIMLPVLLVHVLFGILITLENHKAKGRGYAVSESLKSTFSSRNMIWSGVLIAGFLVYHLLHFTFQIVSPETAALANMDLLGRPDVTDMVISGFQSYLITLLYAVSLFGLFLHLAHGVQSSFQTLGLGSDAALPVISKSAYIMAVLVFVAYVMIPVAIISGFLKG
jgi:succinate dehydrogenase / fumarate reductase cytochrome b subunit